MVPPSERGDGPPPLRVLVSAYSCEPGRGSEPGAGWEWTMAAASRHRVWLVTSSRHAGPVRAALAVHRPPGLEAVLFLEEEVGGLRRRDVPGGEYLHYWRWQRAARPVLARLHQEHAFDLGHHLTWAADWQPAAVAGVPGLPFLWGPVGGATPMSLRLARWLGLRGLAADVAREISTRAGRRLVGDRLAREAALVLAQNEDTRRRFARHGAVEVAPNLAIRLSSPGASDPERPAPGTRAPEGGRAVFAGRLIAWKGLRLAVAAIARSDDWCLDVYGKGPEEKAAKRLASRLGVGERVRFLGRRPRADVLSALAAADALLFPSVHDSAPWIVAEAVTMGVPVVCLDRGGPPVAAKAPLAGVAVATDGDVAGRLAAALEALPVTRPVDWWRVERLPDEIERHYRLAANVG